MLKPLDREKLAALLSGHRYPGCAQICIARMQLGEGDGDMMNGLLALLDIYPSTFEARLGFEVGNMDIRWIHFRDSPFRSLRLVPASGNAIDIYAFGQRVQSFEILGCPHNWVTLLEWLWNYGHERQVAKVKHGTLLPLLNPELYDAVANESDDAGPPLLRQAHYNFVKGDVGEGVYMLLMAFQLCSPRLHREATNPEIWHISFKESPLRTLRIQSSTDCRETAIFALDKSVAIFRLIDSPSDGPTFSGLKSRQQMLEWIWDYGNQRLESRLRYEAQQSEFKQKKKSKRTKNPLLHKVLHTAGFKAQHLKSSKYKTVKLNLRKEDDIMEDVEEVNLDYFPEKPLSCQLPAQKSPLRATDPNSLLGTAPRTKDKEDYQTAKHGVESVNIGGLKVQDHQH